MSGRWPLFRNDHFKSIRESSMVTVGNLIRVDAKPGKADEVESMLKAAVAVVSQEQFPEVTPGQDGAGVIDAVGADVQLASWSGATVLTTVSSAEKAALATRLAPTMS
jgi:hypothetical protein